MNKKVIPPENLSNIYKKCTLTITPCVWIHFRGDKTNKYFPELPEDGGLVGEFLRWSYIEEIFPVEHTPGTSGGGIHAHAYDQKDIPRIIEWFKNKGVQIIMGS